MDGDQDDEREHRDRADRLHRGGNLDGRRVVLQKRFVEPVAPCDQDVAGRVRADDRQHDDAQLQARSRPRRHGGCTPRIDTRRQERGRISVRRDQDRALGVDHLIEDVLRKRFHDLLERMAQVDARRAALAVELHALHDILGHAGQIAVAQPTRLKVRDQRPRSEDEQQAGKKCRRGGKHQVGRQARTHRPSHAARSLAHEC